MKSINLSTIVDRSENGSYMKESDFDMKVAMTTMRLVNEYGIKFDPQDIVPTDNDMADRLYHAALDLFIESGVYNQSTERIIKFSREEVEDAMAHAPASIVLGTGKDTIDANHLGIESGYPCVIHSGPTGTPTSEKYQQLIYYSCAQEPLVDCLGGGSVSTINNQLVIPGSPLELMAARRDAVVAREALRQAGRPGMHINDVATPLTNAGKMACFEPENALRPSDGLLVSQFPELKTDYDQLSRVVWMKEADMVIVNLMGTLLGGIGGGPEGTALVEVANHILGVICYSADYHIIGILTLRWADNTGRMPMWAFVMAGQALARNTSLITTNTVYTRNGLGTVGLWWEVAASTVASTVCGIHQLGVGATGGVETDQTSGLEARFNAEVSHACRKWTRDQANEFVLECLNRYEESQENPKPGAPFSKLYNLETIEPKDEFLDGYYEVRDEIIGMGLDLDNGWKGVRNVQR